MHFKSLIIVAVLVAVVAMTLGCTSSSTNTSGTAMNAANVTADRILNSFNTVNYNEFSANFSPTMLAATNQSWFNATQNSIQAKYGNYQSRDPVPTAGVVQGYNVYMYKSYFEKGNFTLQITMNTTNVWQVEGIFFR
jgi:hypothetical protein